MLFGFLAVWSEFVIALTVTSTAAAQTLPVGISTLITQFLTLLGEMAAIAVVYLLPVLTVTDLCQRGLFKGLMSGGRAAMFQHLVTTHFCLTTFDRLDIAKNWGAMLDRPHHR